MKGAIQVDYILAVSIFLVFFALTIQYTTDYFSTVRETADITDLRSEAISLLGVADRGFEPAAWPQFANITNDLVLLMHFNNDTLDYSGKVNDGVALNGVNCSSSVGGRFFSACTFDSVDDFINVTHSASLNLSASPGITMAAWVRGYDHNLEERVIDKRQTAGGQQPDYMMRVNPAGESPRFSCFITNITGAVEPRVDASSFENNTWIHFACTYNGTNFTIYKNGNFDNSVARYGSVNSSNTSLTIGGSAAGELVFNGTIDEVAVWNRSLSAAEINELYQQSLKRIGLRTEAFRFIVIVNNTKPFLVNTSENATAITLVDELVVFNLSTFSFSDADYNSVVIYNSTNSQMPFMINGSNITFRTNISANASAQFTVYFDDDSGFLDKSLAITGVDNLTETFHPVERISILQHEKLIQLNQSNYTNVRSKADVENNFRITLLDVDTNATIMNFGETVPRSGNIIALQRHVVFQNSTAGIRNGRLTIRTW